MKKKQIFKKENNTTNYYVKKGKIILISKNVKEKRKFKNLLKRKFFISFVR